MINRFVPKFIYKRLWGDRMNYPPPADTTDQDWKIWKENIVRIYTETIPHQSIITNMGFNILCHFDFSGKKILEIGPGVIRHIPYIKGIPEKYFICDVEKEFLNKSLKKLQDANIPSETILLQEESLTLKHVPSSCVDFVLSFSSLEHIVLLNGYLTEIKRILKPNGHLTGTIPCEGGLLWGVGRFLTTRRFMKKKYGIDYDKLICWEHVNFADQIFKQLDNLFICAHKRLHPFKYLPIDCNLMASFDYINTK